MARVFHRRSNTLARVTAVAVPGVIVLVGLIAWGVENSPVESKQGIAWAQPVPFSHKHHVSGLGIDCRYCHTAEVNSSFAGIPPTKTCMTCHSQIWTNAPVLAPVRESWRTGRPISWRRVNNLPQYVYFDHSIHIAKGVGCVTCHGQVDAMPIMEQGASLQMMWCLKCHKDPAKNLRPRDQVWDMHYVQPKDQAAVGKELAKRYEVRPSKALIDCWTCHR